MTKILQLQRQLNSFVAAHHKARLEFEDALYIVWMIDFIFDGKPPAPEIRQKFTSIMNARNSKAFRELWDSYKDCKLAISNFQLVNMGIISESLRKQYTNKFKKEHPEEVPF